MLLLPFLSLSGNVFIEDVLELFLAGEDDFLTDDGRFLSGSLCLGLCGLPPL